MSRRAFIRALFDGAAARWQRDVSPVLEPLAEDFARFAAPQPDDTVLDAGTGIGTLARFAAPRVRRVTGIDLAPAMLAQARRAPGIAWVRGDLHRLPFADRSFSVVMACFGLNATDPDRSLSEVRRVLPPGGRLAIQEWGAAGPLYEALAGLLEDYAVADPAPEPLASLRAGLDAFPPLWERDLQDADDYAETLTRLGFRVEHAAETAPLTIPMPAATYLSFFLSTAIRHEEIRALPDQARAAFFAAARARLAGFAAPDGTLSWRPAVIRALAQRSA